MIERKWAAANAILTSLGTTAGTIAVDTTFGFRVKATVRLSNPPLPDLTLEVKRVVSETIMELGPKGNIDLRADLSLYGVGSTVFAPLQFRNDIPLKDIERAVYEEEPVVAIRVTQVDRMGSILGGPENPVNVISSSSSVTKHIAILFLSTDWVSNKMVCLQQGVPSIPGEIGPHNIPIGALIDSTVWKFIGPGYLKEVGLTIVNDTVTGKITIIKAALAPNFSGVLYVDGY
jgi:hypothetical protein